MEPEAIEFLFDAPGQYRIRIHGELDSLLFSRFGYLTELKIRVSGKTATTALTGTVLDQACLLGLLTELYDLGFVLLEVKRLAGPAATASAKGAD